MTIKLMILLMWLLNSYFTYKSVGFYLFALAASTFTFPQRDPSNLKTSHKYLYTNKSGGPVRYNNFAFSLSLTYFENLVLKSYILRQLPCE